MHNYHFIIFYIIYVDHLIKNIFRTVSLLSFRPIEYCSLFCDTSDSMRLIFSTGIWCREKHLFPNIPSFFEWRAKISVGQFFGNLPDWKFFARHSKNCGIFGNKCFSLHQIPVEKIYIIESEVTQNKEQLFNCTKHKKLTVLKISSFKLYTYSK